MYYNSENLYLPAGVVISDPCYTRNWTKYGCAEIENMKPWNYHIGLSSLRDADAYWLFHESLKPEDLKEEKLTEVGYAWADAWMFWFFDLNIFPKNEWRYSEAFLERCQDAEEFMFHCYNDDFEDAYKGYVIHSWDCSVWIKGIKDKKWEYVALYITYA